MLRFSGPRTLSSGVWPHPPAERRVDRPHIPPPPPKRQDGSPEPGSCPGLQTPSSPLHTAARVPSTMRTVWTRPLYFRAAVHPPPSPCNVPPPSHGLPPEPTARHPSILRVGRSPSLLSPRTPRLVTRQWTGEGLVRTSCCRPPVHLRGEPCVSPDATDVFTEGGHPALSTLGIALGKHPEGD